MRRRVGSLIRVEPLNARDTVDFETFVCRAMSSIVEDVFAFLPVDAIGLDELLHPAHPPLQAVRRHLVGDAEDHASVLGHDSQDLPHMTIELIVVHDGVKYEPGTPPQ